MYQLQNLTRPLHAVEPLDLSYLPQLADIGCQPVDLQVYDQLLEVR